MHAGVGAVDDVDISAIVDFDIIRLDHALGRYGGRGNVAVAGELRVAALGARFRRGR
jgi:hypothetical protein